MTTRIFIMSLCICTSINLFATRWYITPTGAGSHTGVSWTNACGASQIQQLINSSGSCDSIFMASGVYKPTNSTDPNISIALKNHAKIFGGFPHPSTTLANPSWANRNGKLFPTVFSGDLGNDDINTDANFFNQSTDSIVGNNSFHLFSGDNVENSCIIDGCVIVGGKGGSYGGGFYNYYRSSPTVKNCYIVGNQAQYGGACYNYVNSSPSFLNCVFSGNKADAGGAIYGHSSCNAIITRTQFLNNEATQQGGAIFSNYAYPVITNCVFTENEAIQGGAIYNHYSSIVISSSVLYQNSANIGGAIYNNSSSISVSNLTICQNIASSNGGGIKNVGTSTPKIRNSIVWGNIANTGSNIANNSGCNPIINNSIIEALLPASCPSCPSNPTGSVNPQFTQINDGNGADNIWMTNDDGLRLKPCSQGINAGANMYVPQYVTLDVRGKNRYRQQVADIGAYENADFAGEGYLTTLNAPNTTLTACEECLDVNGWTHYYDTVGKKMVLSLFKNGYNVGHIGDGVFDVKSYTTNNYGSSTATNVQAPYAQNSDWYVMNRWWNLTPNPQLPAGNTGVKVRTYFTQQDVNDVNGSLPIATIPITQFRFYKINGASASLDPNNDGNTSDAHAGISRATTYDDNGYWEYVYSPNTSSIYTWRKGDFNGIDFAEYEIARFSGGGGGGAPNGGGAFPIKILSFEGYPFETGTALNWWTEEEIPGGHFVVEKSKNGIDFEAIGDIEAAGNSLDKYQYNFFDKNPYWGTNYYRLRLTDFEGYTDYSEMVELSFESKTFNIYPNPVKDMLTIDGNFPDRSEIFIYDLYGKEMQRTPINGNISTKIDVSMLPKGRYFFKLADKDGDFSEYDIKQIVIQD